MGSCNRNRTAARGFPSYRVQVSADEGHLPPAGAAPTGHTPKTFPWFPTYVQDWLAVPGTPEQKGVLMNLRCFAWQQDPPCSLPDDDHVLAAVSGLHGRWAELGPSIRALYLRPHPSVAGRLLEPLLYARFVAQVQLSMARQTAGKTGGKHSANTRAGSKQPGKQTGAVASSVASILPENLSYLESSTAVKDKIPNGLQASPEQTTSKPPEVPDAERAEYNARLASLIQRARQTKPDRVAELEAEVVAAWGFAPAELLGESTQARLKRQTIDAEVDERIRIGLKVPTFEEFQRGVNQETTE